MYIASVFAQLERETIAERIRDNMMLLARTGRWLGGNTPLGFQSTEVSTETIDGKVKKSFKLKPCEPELDIVRVIYSKYCELRSLTKMETYLLQNGFKTRQGKDFSTIAVREILANPVYCVADQTAYDYFAKMEADVCCEKSGSQFDGTHGIAAYNRTTNEGKLQSKNPVREWIVTVGRHPGIIPSKEWIKVQEIAKSNQPKPFAGRVQNSASLLSGLLVCAKCGSFLRPRVNSNKRRDEHGNQTFAYLCDKKKKSKYNSNLEETISVDFAPRSHKRLTLLIEDAERTRQRYRIHPFPCSSSSIRACKYPADVQFLYRMQHCTDAPIKDKLRYVRD